jgi:hypothetical protein
LNRHLGIQGIFLDPTHTHTSTIQSWDSTHYCGNKVHNRTQTLMWVRDNIVCSISHVHPNINYFFSLLSVLTKAQVYFTGTRIPDPPPPFFLIWSLPRLWYGSLSGSIYLNHLSIFYNISCYNSLVLLTFVSRSSCRITYIHKGMKQSSKYKEGILASTRYFTITRRDIPIIEP